jgi:predicted metal-dependent hydrolase
VPAQELRRRTLAWALRLRVTPKVVRIQSMRHKWGSCSSKGTLTLALDLADQEPDFQEFVIAHELLHLRIPNHGRLFKALLTAYVPQWRRLHAARRASRTLSDGASPTTENQNRGTTKARRQVAAPNRDSRRRRN